MAKLRSLLILLVAGLTAVIGGVVASPAQAATTCDAFGSITQGKYWLNNNLWGQGSGSGWQCVSDNYTSGDTIGWSTDWSWNGGENSVKSYASAVLGWHWGWKNPNSGLPVRLSGSQDVTSSWDFQVSSNPGTMNVAYDMWLHERPDPTYEHNPTDEIMIWPYSSGGAGPIGNVVANVTIDGVNWNLHRGNIGWNVFSFVATSNRTSVDLNLSSFLDNLVTRGWVPDSKYLTSVQAGTEVFHGTGTLTTTAYSVNVGSGSPGGSDSGVIARHSGKCLDVIGASTADGAEVAQYTCSGGANQQWRLQDAGGGYVRLVAGHSGKCLDVEGASTANGARILQWSCNSGANQQWQVQDAGGGYSRLIARHSGKCIDIAGSSTADGVRLTQWDCGSGQNQQWAIS
ncbi:RICIN domain-containing protein [Glycomyces sp. TRM65418]|uniref:RICIN domain-containing protein n=1 Tax=Glycomyces sp. TRM65418 TaxID=2867006 RepID=UPI001CE5ADAA|nr:RICIN domain-containing protein [Glycomyces sp. TRM65418]MCC3764492.1 RICIN domain-containing protein [Glycomyces sp. TRM65418]QZD54163.1 RICIN domain-containing protein [Glycomyces sp. TRM65418]